MDSISYAQGIFNIKTKPVDFKTEKIVSYSQYSTYSSCPKKWALKYIDKQKVPSESISLVYGTAMHTIFQLYIKTMYTETLKKANELDLDSLLFTALREEYLKRVEINGSHFSNPTELSTYYNYGVEIFKYFKKHRGKYFSTKNTKLIGIELPISTAAFDTRPNTRLECHLDLVLYNSIIDKYSIIDIKTSMKGWNDWAKKDKFKTNQLVLYKKYFCGQFNIDPSKVDVQYFILKAEIDTNSLWPQKRIQEFAPSHGKVSMKSIYTDFKKFVDTCFKPTGEYNTNIKYPAIVKKGGYNCVFCPYNERFDLCPKENRINE